MNKNEFLAGKVSCNRNILLSIITLAAKEVSGVSGLVENFRGGISKWLSKNYSGGVRINYFNNNTKISIDVFLTILYGYNVSDVSARVQENIKSSVNSMLDIEIESINVNIIGIDFSKEQA